MAERIFSRWQQDEEDAYNSKMKRLIRAYEKISLLMTQKAFCKWREFNNETKCVHSLEVENQQLRDDVKELQEQNHMYEEHLHKKFNNKSKVSNLEISRIISISFFLTKFYCRENFEYSLQ
jgi:predicted RNase H-like nuclease (RuvC/YqgF family)